MIRAPFLIVTLLLSPVSLSNSYPTPEEIAELAELAEDLSVLKDMSEIASSVGSLVTAGSTGAASIPIDETELKNGSEAVEVEQIEPWDLIDEYTYSAQTDLDFESVMDCLDYFIVGGCLSVRWTIWGPKYTSAFAVEHFVRDLHVEVIPQLPAESTFEVPTDTVLPSSNDVISDMAMSYPFTWKVMTELGDQLMINPLDIVEAEGQTVRTKQSRFLYSDVQVSGNMERHMFDSVASSTIGNFGYCTSPTISGNVYYHSGLDQFSWRWMSSTEMVLTALWQLKYLNWSDIGRSYGSTIPRSGYIVQNNRFQTSVVSAIRATNIAAENRSTFSGLAGLHVYQPLPLYALSSFTGSRYQTPQDAKTLKLKFVYPYQSVGCQKFGADESYLESSSTQNQLLEQTLLNDYIEGNGRNSAAFKVYRPYRCCKKRGNAVWDVVMPEIGTIGTPK